MTSFFFLRYYKLATEHSISVIISPVVATGLPLRRSRLACFLPSKHLVARLFIPGLWSWLCAAQGLEVDFESLQIVLSQLRVT